MSVVWARTTILCPWCDVGYNHYSVSVVWCGLQSLFCVRGVVRATITILCPWCGVGYNHYSVSVV